MKKQLIIATLLAILFLGVALIVKYNSKSKYQNIFDEIYYGEESIFHIPYGSSSFSNIPGIQDRPRRDDKIDDSVFENYTDNVTIDKLSWSICFSFNFPEKIFSIYFRSDLQEERSISIVYDYFKDKHLLVEKVYVSQSISKYDRKHSKKVDTIKKYLDESGIPVESIRKAADQLLYDKVIEDWITYTNSAFSKENIGKVTIERSPFFKD